MTATLATTTTATDREVIEDLLCASRAADNLRQCVRKLLDHPPTVLDRIAGDADSLVMDLLAAQHSARILSSMIACVWQDEWPALPDADLYPIHFRKFEVE